MSSGGASRPALSDAELVEMLALVREADSVELKLTIPEADQRAVVTALELDPLDAEIRQVFFLDTLDLALERRGRDLAASGSRRHQGGRAPTPQ